MPPCYDLTDKIIMRYQICTAKMENSCPFLIDDKMDLLGQFLNAIDIDNRIWKNFNGLVLLHRFINLYGSGRMLPKNHRQSGDDIFGRWQSE